MTIGDKTSQLYNKFKDRLKQQPKGHNTSQPVSPTTSGPQPGKDNKPVPTAPLGVSSTVTTTNTKPITSGLPPPLVTSSAPIPVLAKAPSDPMSVPANVPYFQHISNPKTWTSLKTLAKVLEEGTIVLSPLRSAVDAIGEYIDIYESAAQGRNDYKALRTELEGIFQDLAMYFGGPMPPVFTPVIENLSRSIIREIELLKQRQPKSQLGRYIGAKDMEDQVLECYRRIQGYLGRVALNANLNIWKIVNEQATKDCLKDLSPSRAAWYSSVESANLRRSGCTPNTRVDFLAQLREWANNERSKKLYWLNGMAGTGKTTIAYSLSDELASTQMLAASFFCSRQLPTCRNTNFIIPTISYQLALLSYPFRYALSRALEETPEVPYRQLSEQFEQLFARPLREVGHTIPANLVVVIDALDECDEGTSGVGLLDLLLSHASELPVKFLVTSRPEPHIMKHMQGQHDLGNFLEFGLQDIDRTLVQEDIKTYLATHLTRIQLGPADLQKIAEQAGVLFIYAATIVRYVGAHNSARRLKQVLDTTNSSPNNKTKSIDALYTAILVAAFDESDLEDLERQEMMLVLGTIICAQEPLTTGAVANLVEIDSESSVRAAISPLLSVLNLSGKSGVVTTLHTSFSDYLVDPKRSGHFYCNAEQHHERLAQRCFEVIKVPNPPFNICGLESSYLLDADIPNLNERVEKAIPKELLYASQYWMSHLEYSAQPQSLLDAFNDYLCTRLLLWMEIMNLKKRIHLGAKTMTRAYKWSNDNCSSDIQVLTNDAAKFVAAYSSSPASQSTPHIYVSMLPFWPEQTPISTNYFQKIRDPVSVVGPAMNTREPELISAWISKDVRCAAFSPNGLRIVSGSGDKNIRIWDTLSGQIIREPLKGHNDAINSIAYSLDGERIVSGSGDRTIRIWDAQSGEALLGPLIGHTEEITSVAFLPSGTRIASGSYDNTIRIWDTQTGHLVCGPLTGHTHWVMSVSCSPDGIHIASGSFDDTIRVWDTVSGQMVGEPFVGHTGALTSIAYSPNGEHIISGSWDQTIMVWDSKTGKTAGGPLIGHSSVVISVAYSTDGAQIASSSFDNTIKIWDVKSNSLLKTLEGHNSIANTVSFSPDGAYIVSCTNDNIIRIWSTHSSQTIDRLLEGHSSTVIAASYSPDGRCIISCSNNDIRIWDARTCGMMEKLPQSHAGSITSVSYSPDGAHIVSGSSDGIVCLWDLQHGQRVGTLLKGHTDGVNTVVYSLDGTRIASGSHDHSVVIWDTQSHQMVGQPLKGHTGWVMSVAYSPDGNHVISGSYDNTIRVWSTRSGQKEGHPLTGHSSIVSSVAYSPNGVHIVSGSWDKTIRIWDSFTFQMVGIPLEGHTREIYSVSYSPDGAHIVSGSNDKSIRVWDAKTGLMAFDPLMGHTDGVKSIRYSPDGKTIISGSHDRTIRIWNGHNSKIRDAEVVTDSPLHHPIDDWYLDERGWVVTKQGHLLIWVPLDLHGLLIRPQNINIISKRGWLKLDFSSANIGGLWTKCLEREVNASLLTFVS